MSRPRQPIPTRRYHLTLDRTTADRLGAYARATRRPLSTAAAALITEALSRRPSDESPELREARRQVEELTAHVQALHRQLAAPTARLEVDQVPPRWEWPMEALLADTAWWDRWLPRLGELLGRGLASVMLQPGRQQDPLVDERGYNDLLSSLFPPIADQEGTVTWRSPRYQQAARRWHGGAARIDRASALADVWEPVIRHTAEAVCLLESTGSPGADPYLRLRAEAEITGPWVRVLRYLVGEDEPELPRQRLV